MGIDWLFRGMEVQIVNGVVGMYEWDGSSWNIMGSTLTGSTSHDFLGYGISLDADGDQVAVGIRGEDGSAGDSSGAVSIYSWGGSSWSLVGSTVEGSVASKGFGGSVSISSSGEMFVAGASSSGVGYAKVYKWNGSAWAQEGSTIDGLILEIIMVGLLLYLRMENGILLALKRIIILEWMRDEFKCIAQVLHWCILLLLRHPQMERPQLM